ncbi:hypothetical protein LMG27198_48460 [Methylocystis echinoides]|uniref:Uncharacterized protein n=1 Tax=Methylocystis echinoides TaxID=29468 RepID=A0A9W6GZN3_9HYPH|nr:hypothetical protein LMG27198_48460 [Methylocystis echinoides]
MGARLLCAEVIISTMRESIVSLPTLSALITNLPVFERAADHIISNALDHWHGLARHHGLIHRTPALDKGSIDWDLLPRANAQAVADANLLQSDFLVRTVISNTLRRDRGEVKQGANSPARLFPSADVDFGFK